MFHSEKVWMSETSCSAEREREGMRHLVPLLERENETSCSAERRGMRRFVPLIERRIRRRVPLREGE